MAKFATQGTKLQVEDPDTPGSYLDVGNLKSLPTPSPSKPEIDVTDLDSSGAEFLAGLPDFGELAFSGWYNTSSAGQAVLKQDGISTTGTVRSFKIIFTNLGFQQTFNAFVKSFKVQADLNSAYTFDGSLRVSGVPVETAYP